MSRGENGSQMLQRFLEKASVSIVSPTYTKKKNELQVWVSVITTREQEEKVPQTVIENSKRLKTHVRKRWWSNAVRFFH
jgi:glycyl-tRNA synthetase beta subunit